MMSRTVSLVAEVPEELYASLKGYLEKHTLWDQDRVIRTAISLFLMQNGFDQQTVSNIYLDSLFNSVA